MVSSHVCLRFRDDTVLIINYDEHGGFSDHVPTPMTNIPPPNSPYDGPSYPDKFAFDRLGVRVPMIVVSPLVPAGLVVSAPKSGHYEHCSVLGTVRKLLGVSGNLTARDGWAATFEHIFSLDSPRSTPTRAPEPPPPSMHPLEEMQLPVNDLQHEILGAHNAIASHLFPDHVSHRPEQQGQVHAALRNAYSSIRKSIQAHDSAYSLVVVPLPHSQTANILEWHFTIDSSSSTIRSRSLNVSGTPFCWTLLPDGNVSVALCRTVRSADAPQQSFFFRPDSSIRIGDADSSYCVTLSDSPDGPSFGTRTVYAAACSDEDSLRQRFGYWGPAPGNDDVGAIVWGNLVSFFVVVPSSAKP
jgi:hypothetical protein